LRRLTHVQPDGLAGDEGRRQLIGRFDQPPSLIVFDSVGEGMGQAKLNEKLNEKLSKEVAKFSVDPPLRGWWITPRLGLRRAVRIDPYGNRTGCQEAGPAQRLAEALSATSHA
jgi:hypothetical protein